MVEVARKVNDRVTTNLETVVKELTAFRNKKPSQVAAAIVYQSRKDEYELM
jgi:hypothetical protein